MPAHLKYLLEKNWIVLKRNWKWLLAEQILVIIFFIFIILNPVHRIKNYFLKLEEMTETELHKNQTSLYDLSVFQHLWRLKDNKFRFAVHYTPKNNFTTAITKSLQETFHFQHINGYNSEELLANNFMESHIFTGLVFHNVENGEIPKQLSFTLRFPSEFRTIDNSAEEQRFWITRCCGVLNSRDTLKFPHTDLYLREGFLQIQHRIFMEWLKMLKIVFPAETTSNPSISINSVKYFQEPNPCHIRESTHLNRFLTYFTFLLTFLHIIKILAREREENIQAHHWIYGYEQSHHRFANFLITFPRLLMLNLWIAIILSINHPLPLINFGCVLLFLILYSTLLTIYAMIIVTLFMNAKNTVIFGAVMWLGNYGFFTLTLDYDQQLNGVIILTFVLFFNNLLPYGLNVINRLASDTDLTRIWFLYYTEILIILLLLLALSILEYKKPGHYVKRFPYNFMGIAFYCFRNRKVLSIKRKPVTTSITSERECTTWQHYENAPMSNQEILCLKNITTYNDEKRIRQQLKNISMKIYLNEITVILGAYSTGKTRLITFLAGWCKPPNGNIYYNSHMDIYENWRHYRQQVDVSMPNNTLFDFLNVYETLLYFCKIKMQDFKKEIASEEILKWLNILSPAIEDRKQLVKNLNFSQKRLLSLCCTLMANRSIILLDEPTLHMTAVEQRLYWQILRNEKTNRSIIVTTFSIDEADIIGDRIGIISEGFLSAYGTSFYLRTHLGKGFDLIILKDSSKDSLPITNLIGKYFHKIEPVNLTGEQLIYKLPVDKRHLYQLVLLELEKQTENLGITGIRIRGSELNEIFMTLGRNRGFKQVLPSSDFKTEIIEVTQEKSLKLQQIRAMLYKKAIFQAPNVIPLIWIFVLYFLINLINFLTEHQDTPLASISTSINLGYNSMANESREFLREFENCKFIEIDRLENMEYLTKINNKTRNLFIKKLNCGQKSYEDHARKSSDVMHKYGGVERDPTGENMAIWLNENIFHSSALVLNLAHNLILQNLYPHDYQIFTTITNKPMDIPLHTSVDIVENQITHLKVPLTLGIVMPITVSCFILNIVEERFTHLFTLQRIAGIRMNIFWITSFLWDYGTFFAYSIVFVMVLAFNTIAGFETLAKLLTFLLINVYGLTELALIYILSSIINGNKWEVFFKTILIQFLTGLSAYVFYWDTMNHKSSVYYLMRLSPTFSLLDGVSKIYILTNEKKYCENRCESVEGCNMQNLCNFVPNCCTANFRWTVLGIVPSLGYMMLSFSLFSLIFFFVNLYHQEKKFCVTPRIKKMNSICYPQDDEDVIKEKMFIASMLMSNCKKYNVVVDQIENEVPNKCSSQILRTVSFALNSHTSMAIYGSRHSGKTHLIHQLVGDNGYHFGEMFICEKDCRYQSVEAYKYLGFCPHDTGFCSSFTPRQLFTLLFMIRGLSKAQVKDRMQEITLALDLHNIMDLKMCEYNKFVKQKLYIGAALIINSKVLILDEPTRGMSAKEKLIIWNVLQYARNCGVTIIFTSSESAECEAISDYMIVVDQGEMLAIGSLQYLKEKYTKGLYLELKLRPDGSTVQEANKNLELDIDNVKRYICFLNEDSVLITQTDYYLKLYIPLEHMKYSFLFGSLEKTRNRLNIAEYTLREPSFLDALAQMRNKHYSRPQYSPDEIKDFDILHIDQVPFVDNTIRASLIYPKEIISKSPENSQHELNITEDSELDKHEENSGLNETEGADSNGNGNDTVK